MGDWGLGIGDRAQSPIPNPQSPIPNPQSPFKNYIKYNKKKYIELNNYFLSYYRKNFLYILYQLIIFF
jgi:hypothetical protein